MSAFKEATAIMTFTKGTWVVYPPNFAQLILCIVKRIIKSEGVHLTVGKNELKLEFYTSENA